MSTQKACDICRMYRQNADGSPAVARYTLRRDTYAYRQQGIRHDRRQYSSGGIDICDECWARICEPRMNARKSHPRRAA